jgi:hypothetical protein
VAGAHDHSREAPRSCRPGALGATAGPAVVVDRHGWVAHARGLAVPDRSYDVRNKRCSRLQMVRSRDANNDAVEVHRKLVRDRIPDVIAANGDRPHWHRLVDDSDYLAADRKRAARGGFEERVWLEHVELGNATDS